VTLTTIQEVEVLVQRQHELAEKNAEAMNVLCELLDVAFQVATCMSHAADNENDQARRAVVAGH